MGVPPSLRPHLAALLQRVAKGETIQITRRGVPVAKLAPVDAPQRQDRRELAQEIRRMRKGLSLGGLTIRELINEGRRF
ncbi:MAG: type II toxin-antitoxin system prevent-host-death family antitoxin [Thermodesulfobacteriota bacterium]